MIAYWGLLAFVIPGFALIGIATGIKKSACKASALFCTHAGK